MERIEHIKLSIRSRFYGEGYDHSPYSVSLSNISSEGIWNFVVCNENFKTFFLGCLNDIEEQLIKTGQHLSDVRVSVEIYDRNCDVDEMVCKNISVAFYTVERTNKEFTFEDRISLSDFSLPADIAVNGALLISLIKKEIEKQDRKDSTLFFFLFLMGFIAMTAMLLIKSVSVSTIFFLTAGFTIWSGVSLYNSIQWFRKYIIDYNVLIINTGTDWILSPKQNAIPDSKNINP